MTTPPVSAPHSNTSEPEPEDALPALVVVGHGMVGQRFLMRAIGADLHRTHRIIVIGDDTRAAYDRVALSSYFDGATADDLALTTREALEADGIDVLLGERVRSIDRTTRSILLESETSVDYNHLVLATGSRPFVPLIPGHDLPGVFVYRTIDDLDAIAARASERPGGAGVVLGGGLLGLEAANALRNLGLRTAVVEMASHLMPRQIDAAGGAVLADRIEGLGVEVRLGTTTQALLAGSDGSVASLRTTDGRDLDADLVVISAGIRPNHEIAADAGLTIGERGGIVVDDWLATGDPFISAIGECVSHNDVVYGLVAPGYRMAETLVDRLTGGSKRFEGASFDAKLKLLGIDVASFGDPFGVEVASEVDGNEDGIAATVPLCFHDARSGVYRRIEIDRYTGAVRGGMLVGDATGYETLALMAAGHLATPADPGYLVSPASSGQPHSTALPDECLVCSCEQVSAGTIRAGVRDGCADAASVKATTSAGSGCGGCVPLVTTLVRTELASMGIAVDRSLCEHFDYTRQELFDLVRIRAHHTWADVVGAHGRGRGCEICRPVVASILASLSHGHILDGDQAALQDTNDHFLANIQRNGTYSVVPRVPGGEIRPDQLIALGQIARDFGLYTKITGGQRIDLFGARLDELPHIWRRVIDCGLESGHAYGKALRTVKSCVGSTWCRYGVQDSVSMAIRVEERYRGLRSPHKLKSAISGCTRECAEAQSKDFGVIATERGWNLYVGGNGGKSPRHGDLFATDLDDETLIRYIDRFLMFYIRTADRLERTSVWIENLDGGLEYLRRVVIDDCLGIADELEADMARHVDSYQCEWTATLSDPDRLRRFTSFINCPDDHDTELVFVEERGQVRPARPDELPHPTSETPVTLVGVR